MSEVLSGVVTGECVRCRLSGNLRRVQGTVHGRREHIKNYHPKDRPVVKELMESQDLRILYLCLTCKRGYCFPSGILAHYQDNKDHYRGRLDLHTVSRLTNISWEKARPPAAASQIFHTEDAVDFFGNTPLKGNKDMSKTKDQPVNLPRPEKVVKAGRGTGMEAEMAAAAAKVGAQPASPSTDAIDKAVGPMLLSMQQTGKLNQVLRVQEVAEDYDMPEPCGGLGRPPLGDLVGLTGWVAGVHRQSSEGKEWTSRPTRKELKAIYDGIDSLNVCYTNNVKGKIVD